VLRRYILISILIIVIAIATTGLAYSSGNKLTYRSYCTVQVFVRAPAVGTGQPNPEFLQFTNSLAANEVGLATPTAYKEIAQKLKTTTGLVTNEVALLPAPGIGAFAVTVSDPNAERAKSLANTACNTYVDVIKKQRATELNNEVKTIQDRLNSIEAVLKKLLAIPAKKRTTSQAIELQTQSQALKFNAVLIATYRSLPPDQISVLRPAATVTAAHSISLKKYLLIAGAAALLSIFLVILIGEALSPSNRATAP
jgi:hypothetical protein